MGACSNQNFFDTILCDRVESHRKKSTSLRGFSEPELGSGLLRVIAVVGMHSSECRFLLLACADIIRVSVCLKIERYWICFKAGCG